MQRIIALKNGTVTMIHTDAGYYTPTGLPPGASGPSYVHLWYLAKDAGAAGPLSALAGSI